jgi:hypothetical protein
MRLDAELELFPVACAEPGAPEDRVTTPEPILYELEQPRK